MNEKRAAREYDRRGLEERQPDRQSTYTGVDRRRGDRRRGVSRRSGS